MTTYVFWWSDIWGWDTSPGARSDDLLREAELGFRAMSVERMENTSISYWDSVASDFKRGTRWGDRS